MTGKIQTKYDLKPGMIVKYRNLTSIYARDDKTNYRMIGKLGELLNFDREHLLIEDYSTDDFAYYETNELSKYTESFDYNDKINKEKNSSLDIVKVYDAGAVSFKDNTFDIDDSKLLWERPDKLKFTVRIKETRSAYVDIEVYADSEKEGKAFAENLYYDCTYDDKLDDVSNPTRETDVDIQILK